MQMNNSANKNEKNPFLCEKSSAYFFLKDGQNVFIKNTRSALRSLNVHSGNPCVFFFTTGKPPNIFNNCFLGKFL